MTTLNRLLIRDRLNLLVLLPLSVVLLMTVPFVADRVQDARQASTTATLVGTARQLGAVIQELERERLLSIAYLASPGSRRNPLVIQAQAADDAIAAVRGALKDGQAPRLEAALARLETLSTLRKRILQRKVAPQAVNTGFGTAVASLVDALGLSQGVAAGSAGARQQTALDALLRSDEENSSAGAGLLAIVAQPGATSGTQTVVSSSARLSQLEARRFQQLATPAQVALFRAAGSGPAAERVERLRTRLLGSSAPVPVAQRAALASEIFGAVESEAGLRRLVQDKIARDIAEEAQRAATKARLAGLGFATLAIVLLVAVVLLSVAIGRSIARPLRRLTVAAGKVADLAQSELIRVTDEESEEDTPVKLAAVEVSADDEIGDLAAALNRVQATAALLLERQVASRRNIASMFGSVGRRTQNLVGRQLSMIDALERNEQDLELLQRLYRLDHLSARLRRHADSLVVLSGTAEPMLVTSPLSVADVIRSALGEIEDFQRVRLVDVAEARVVPHITRDLKLLIAELLENATSFSPPFTDVEVMATIAADSCQLEIIDHGVGMPPERLAEENARLKRRERLDVAPTDVLGLFVVGRLCRRYGIEVTLGSTPGGGVTAQVKVPDVYLLQPSGVAEQAAGGQRFPGQSPAADQRPGWTQPDRSADSQQPAAAMGEGQPEVARQPFPVADNGSAAQRRPAAPNSRGLVQRIRGAQLPDTGDRLADSQASQETPEAARALVEQFEAGTRRALRVTPVPDQDRLEEPGQDRPEAPGQDRPEEASQDRAPEPDQDQDSHAWTVRSFAMEIDRELRRTLESLTAASDAGSSEESDFHWLDAPHARGARRLRIPAPGEPVEEPVAPSPGLTRRVPGAQMPVTGPIHDPDEYPQVILDADAAREAIEEFEAGVARAMETAEQERPDDGGPGGRERGDEA